MRALSYPLMMEIIGTESVFEDMKNTKEDSPYHREESVFVHTMMLIDWLSEEYPLHEKDYELARFACLMHDIAKPCCRTQKENDKRGIYYSYDRHDVIGSWMCEELLARHNVHEFDIYRISWMIHHHQIFWSTKQRDQREKMARILVERDFYLPFKYFMLADDYGRIADKRTVDSEDYFKKFEDEFLIKEN